LIHDFTSLTLVGVYLQGSGEGVSAVSFMNRIMPNLPSGDTPKLLPSYLTARKKKKD
jgi:hypothetical protein